MLNNFPQDDEFSLQQGDPGGCCDLSIFYGSMFVQAEDHPRAKHRQIFLEHAPLLRGTTTGTVYVQDAHCVRKELCRFQVTEAGKFQGGMKDTNFEYYFDPATCMLNLTTGELFLDNRLLPDYAGIDDFDVVIDYEYSR